jgi:MOSC domain-containing protein YiiM
MPLMFKAIIVCSLHDCGSQDHSVIQYRFTNLVKRHGLCCIPILHRLREGLMSTAHLTSIHAGKVAPLGPDRVPSGFVKGRIEGAVEVSFSGVAGDEQADLTVHGGPEKAVYGYAQEHYADWRREYPRHLATLQPGGFGENFCIAGMRESDICVGDIHRIGSSHLQVCQPRQPCFKLALRFSDNKMPKVMVRTGRAGWYYRVLQPGQTRAGDPVCLEDRPNPDFPFARLVELISFGKATRAELKRLENLSGLASDWRDRAREMLEQHERPGNWAEA